MSLHPVSTASSSFGCYGTDIEEIRHREYPMLHGKTYLDHAGATLYAKSLVENISKDLISNLYGNPHSESSPSAFAGRRIDEIRLKTLQFFNASPEHFDLVFVANATAAIKLVMDSFRDYGNATTPTADAPGFWYGYHRDCHTSLVGVREATTGHHRCFQSDAEVEKWIQGNESARPEVRGPQRGQAGLFSYPGQSNMTGRRLPLDWSARIRGAQFPGRVYTLLDAAALATTAPLDYSNEATAPDFTCLSFYKIFGFPDLGALLVRKSSGAILRQRRAFFGGTVDMVISLGATWHAKKADTLHDALEDGTLPFHSIFALDHALDVHRKLYGSMKRVSAHTASLAKTLFNDLVHLRHYNGQPVVRIYNDAAAVYGDARTQGATVALNIIRSDGLPVGYQDVEKLADKHGIFVRSGSLCNPGGFATYLSWALPDLTRAFENGHSCSRPIQIFRGKPTGVVRVSLGAMSSLNDVKVFVDFVKRNYVDSTYGPVLPFGQLELAEDVDAAADAVVVAAAAAETQRRRRRCDDHSEYEMQYKSATPVQPVDTGAVIPLELEYRPQHQQLLHSPITTTTTTTTTPMYTPDMSYQASTSKKRIKSPPYLAYKSRSQSIAISPVTTESLVPMALMQA